MATNEQGILGSFSGKVGTVIGGNWNGLGYMRGIPGSIANPRTQAQQTQRAKMALIIRFLKPLKSFLRTGFKKQAIGKSAFNAATSCNLARAITGTYPDFAIDYSRVLVSQGKLPGALNPMVTSLGSGQVEFSWQDNSSDKGAMPSDRALLLVVHPQEGKFISVMEGNLRAAKSQVMDLPPYFQEVEVHCYICFQNASQTLISDSRYAGRVVV